LVVDHHQVDVLAFGVAHRPGAEADDPHRSVDGVGEDVIDLRGGAVDGRGGSGQGVPPLWTCAPAVPRPGRGSGRPHLTPRDPGAGPRARGSERLERCSTCRDRVAAPTAARLHHLTDLTRYPERDVSISVTVLAPAPDRGSGPDPRPPSGVPGPP